MRGLGAKDGLASLLLWCLRGDDWLLLFELPFNDPLPNMPGAARVLVGDQSVECAEIFLRVRVTVHNVQYSNVRLCACLGV